MNREEGELAEGAVPDRRLLIDDYRSRFAIAGLAYGRGRRSIDEVKPLSGL